MIDNNHLQIKISLKELFFLVIFLMPVGLSGLGITSKRVQNISFSDFFFFFLLILLFSGKTFFKKEKGSFVSRGIILFYIAYLSLLILSMWNLLRFENGSFSAFLVSLFKIIICLSYSYITALFLNHCGQKDWERFITIAVYSSFIFSLSCIAGGILFFLGKKTFLIDYYVTSFRASGLQEDPNLAAIFQLMSISYILIWMSFTKKKRISKVILASVVLGTLFTVSKAVMITMAICVIVLLLIASIANNKRFVFRLAGAMILAGLIIIVLYNNTNILDNWTSRIFQLLSGDSTVIMTNRDLLWDAAFSVLSKSTLNIFFGTGLGQFSNAALSYSIITKSGRTHNTLISFWVECGLFLPLVIIILLLFILYRLFTNSVNKRDKFSFYSFFGVLALFIFMNSLNFQNNRMAYVFLTFVVVSLDKIKKGYFHLSNF